MNKISDEEEKLKYLAQTLDMPPPWSPKIYIEKDNFLRGTPLGETTTFFIKVKVEKYADYSQPDGLIMKYTLYEVIFVSKFRTIKRLRLDKLDTFSSIVATNSKENIDTLSSSRQSSIMVQVKCIIGKKSPK